MTIVGPGGTGVREGKTSEAMTAKTPALREVPRRTHHASAPAGGLGNRIIQRMVAPRSGPARVRGEVEVLEAPDPAGRLEVGEGLRQGLASRRGRGEPLPAATRRTMEAGLGADLGAVRLHTDVGAARMAGELSARAFTHRSDIFFAGGAYDPGTRAGQHLLAHELVHVVQQRRAGAALQAKLEVGAAEDGREHEADRAADRLLAGEAVGPLAGGEAAIQRAFQRAALVADANVHKSNQKKVANNQANRFTVRSGGIFGTGKKGTLRKGAVVDVDLDAHSDDNTYVMVRYRSGDAQKTGFVRRTSVKTYVELGDNNAWNDTGLDRGFLTEHARELPQSNKRFRNHQQRAIHNETNSFLTAIGGDESGLFDEAPEGAVENVPALDNFDVAPVRGATSPHTITQDQERFLAGLHQELTARQIYQRGFITRYQTNAEHFHAMIRQGLVLWTLDVDGILSIGSPQNNKHAVVAGGKDVFAAGEAYLKSAREYYIDRGELTHRQVELWAFIGGLDAEIEQLQRGNENALAQERGEERQRYLNEIGGIGVYNRITQISDQLAPSDLPLVVLDFGSGHYAPRKAWRRATDMWTQAGFQVEWSKTSQWL